jgi:ABC-type transport system involved in cytochrome bd biosynthesis fused ATPase/permease subunit
MSRRDIVIYALAGLGVWLNGAISFRLGGRILFENGPLVTALVAVVIAALICLVLRATMNWRKASAADAVTIAVIMALPGLFGEAARQLVFPWATGLRTEEAATFASVIFFGNAVLLTYAVVVARRAGAAISAPAD